VSVPIPSDAQADDIKAKLNNGILIIKLKKKKGVGTRKIEIEEED